MSNHEMRKYNIKSIRETNAGLLICSMDNDEWLLKESTLLHRDSRNKRGNVSFHFQRNTKSLYDALDYIKWHTQKYTNPKPRVDRMSYLFSLI